MRAELTGSESERTKPAPRLTPAQRNCLTRVIDRTLGGTLIVSGHERTVQSLMKLGLADYPPSGYYGFGGNSQWRHATLTELGERAARDCGWPGFEGDDE